MIYISQKEAKKILRRAGFSVAASAERVNGLSKTTFGKREKVKAVDVRRIVQEANRPTPPKPIGIRPVSMKASLRIIM